MRYVDHVLQPGEVVRYEGRLSWALFISPTVGVAIGLGLLAAWAVGGNEQVLLGGGLMTGLSLLGLLQVWVSRLVTEIAITDRRVIYKSGIIQRSTIEMNVDKIESVDVQQSILGRLLDYGDVIVRGTGTGFEPIRGVDAPLGVRNSIHVPPAGPAVITPAFGKAA